MHLSSLQSQSSFDGVADNVVDVAPDQVDGGSSAGQQKTAGIHHIYVQITIGELTLPTE
ncbi:hypothetical protein D3C75_1199900 [compost metagenome]